MSFCFPNHCFERIISLSAQDALQASKYVKPFQTSNIELPKKRENHIQNSNSLGIWTGYKDTKKV